VSEIGITIFVSRGNLFLYQKAVLGKGLRLPTTI